MSLPDPLQKSKEDYQSVIQKIAANSSVGIDAQYTHAIIIEFLKQIHQRLDKLEERLNTKGEGK